MTNAGGLGLQCADACAVAGLRLATLGRAAERALAAELPPGSAVVNPVDMTAAATASALRARGRRRRSAILAPTP